MLAPRPAAGPPLTFFQLLLGPADAARACHGLLGVFDPANELIAGERRDVHPRFERREVRDQRLPQICGKLVHDTAWDPAAHGGTVEDKAPVSKKDTTQTTAISRAPLVREPGAPGARAAMRDSASW
jgi:hypothetical protein